MANSRMKGSDLEGGADTAESERLSGGIIPVLG